MQDVTQTTMTLSADQMRVILSMVREVYGDADAETLERRMDELGVFAMRATLSSLAGYY